MSAYYNEIDPKAATWLRELIADGHIAPGEVDERDIRDVKPDDLRPFRQVHLFAGIGGWSAALRKAGWPDDREVWTASCPCQPFSAAGGRSGFADERHLWPAVYHLAGQCRPPVLLGEQVASKDGLAWIDLVSSDMEAAGYAGGAVDLCSAGFGAPNIRQRLYFVWVALADRQRGRGGQLGRQDAAHARIAGEVVRLADANGRNASTEGLQRSRKHGQRPQDGGAGGVAEPESVGHEWSGPARRRRNGPTDDGAVVGMGHSGSARTRRHPGTACSAQESLSGAGRSDGSGSDASVAAIAVGGLDDATGARQQPPRQRQQSEVESDRDERRRLLGLGCHDGRTGPANGFWRASDWIFCTDGIWRPVAPGSFPLASGIPGRVALLRGAGNAINAEVAAGFIEAVMELAQPESLAA